MYIDLAKRVQQLESKMAVFDELTSAVSAQATALTALGAAITALPAPIDHAPLTAAVTALQANTKVIEAMVGALPHE